MSYTSNGGGTLTLPSPTHVHHVDVTSAVRSLRRSLSRSPSKFNLVSRKSPSSSPQSPLSPSPLSPPRRAVSTPTVVAHTPSPLVPFPPSVKLSLRSASRSKTSSPRPTSRTRTSPRSPVRRALSQVSDGGNATSSSSVPSSGGVENHLSESTSPVERKSLEKHSRHMAFNVEVIAPGNYALSRLGDGANDIYNPISSTSSPLKRSDAIMNLDQASLGSPVAKRRSLHGSATFGHDFNVFDHGPPSPQFEIHDDSSSEYETSNSAAPGANLASSPFVSMPGRSSSLRKSTLQQRHGDKTSWGRRHAAQQLSALSSDTSTPNPGKNRPRLSLDQFMPPMTRDSPFHSQGSLPSASVHVMNPPSQPSHQPHPLSRTMTTSSSNSSLAEESPTHFPTNFGQHPKPRLDFSKSLPVGALRPLARDIVSREDSSETFSTPTNYKSVKPLPAAFMSTGLISKVNRNPEEPQVTRGGGKGNVPDTPCKRHVNPFATYPAAVPGSAVARARHIRHSFGTPSTPFNPYGTQPSQGTFGKGSGVFGSSYGKGLSRRSSFLSTDGSENGDAPDTQGESQSSIDYDLPPTPTKQAGAADQTASGMQQAGNSNSSRALPPLTSALGSDSSKTFLRTNSKLNVLTSPGDRDVDGRDGSSDLDDSPTVNTFRFSNTSACMPSFKRSRALRGSHLYSPAPLVTIPRSVASNLSPSSPFNSPSRKPGFAKISHVAPASPLDRIDFIERLSPRTPQDGMLPPDPSGLSISRNVRTPSFGLSSGSSMPPPATPTTGRDYAPPYKGRQLSLTPVHNAKAADIDSSLASRFGKVEVIGTGEFSEVYKVTQRQKRMTRPHSFYFGTIDSPRRGNGSPTPVSDRVFAVKRARQPYQGIRDRQRKLQEVNVLKALGHSDHVVHLIDSWEDKNRLYIQTEYCEEGGLDVFLSQIGRKRRLDDFRVWKIMLEAGQGLKHIHDSGFVHLDLKPANIFITFEGSLKIGDFGMAASWPVQPGIEGEGDREYIGPEILLGQYDQPADVFALGLMMLEIAGNVQLPDNGPTWQRLRSGDMSDVPSLTYSSTSSVLSQNFDEPGVTAGSGERLGIYTSDDEDEDARGGGVDFESPTLSQRRKRHSMPVSSVLAAAAASTTSGPGSSSKHNAANLFGSCFTHRGELHLDAAPAFMNDMYHEHAIDHIVRWMISPDPADRPDIGAVLASEGVRWVERRRRAGATVFEGSWGPANSVFGGDGNEDEEMLDV